jgi:hypothetical protein
MQAIGNKMMASYSYPEREESLTPLASTPTVLSEKKISAVQRTTVVINGYDLTNIKPDEVTTLSAKLYAEGKIEIQQLARLHSIAINNRHPPSLLGIHNEGNANNEPFNLLQQVVEKQEESPLKDQKKPLIEVLTGLQNAFLIEKYNAIDIEI